MAIIPYGEIVGGGTASGDLFATYNRESATGLDYAVNRYYDSVHGRFNTPDRYQADSGTQSPATWNRYSYVHGDPANFTDPRGLWECYDCRDDGSLDCQIGYHWDPFTGFCQPDFPGGTGSSGDDNHPSDPVCSISLYERPVGVPGVGALADHTYLLIVDPSGKSTIEGGPDLIDYPVGYLIGKVSSPPGNGLKGTNPENSATNKHVGATYTGSLACFDVLKIERTESTYNSSGKWVKYDPTAIFGYNSNSFTYTLLSDVGLAGYFGPTIGWTPGWGQLVPGLQ